MSRTLLLGFGLLMLATLAFICLRMNGPAIEADISNRAQQAISMTGMQDVKAVASGRDVTLRGSVWTEQQKELAEQSVSNLDGVREVHNQLEVMQKQTESLPTNLNLQIDYDGTYLALTGSVPSAKFRDALIEKAGKIVGESHVAEDLTIDTSDQQQDSNPDIASVLDALKHLLFAQIVLKDNNALVQGYAASPKARSFVKAGINKSLGSSFDVAFMVDAPKIDDAPNLIDETETEPEDKVDIETQIANCQQQFNELMSTNKITFESGSDIISSESNDLVMQLSELAKQCPLASIEIAGHTDTRGRAEMNQELSEKRAKSVRAALIKLGISAKRLHSIGYGETRPIAKEDTAEGLQKNRRIEFTFKE